jgi:hypothetical protein
VQIILILEFVTFYGSYTYKKKTMIGHGV